MMEHSTSYDERRLQNVVEVAKEAVQSGTHPGIVIGVSDHREMVWSYTVPGSDDIAYEQIFPIASLTKPVVATAIMQLVERGRLLLSDTVARFIPEFGQAGKQHVTVWHLLTHTSGLDERKSAVDALFKQRAPAAAYLDAAYESGLRFEPGTQYEYSNLAFVVLAELITRLGGQPYPEYLRTHIFAPLGMCDTDFAPITPERATPVHNFGDQANIAYFNSLAAPQGGLWSTAADLLAFGRAFLDCGQAADDRLLGAGAIQTMTRLHTAGLNRMVEGKPRPVYNALGWIKPDPNGAIIASNDAFGHGGGTGSFLWIDPAQSLVFVFLCNRWGLEHDVPLRALNAVYGAG